MFSYLTHWSPHFNFRKADDRYLMKTSAVDIKGQRSRLLTFNLLVVHLIKLNTHMEYSIVYNYSFMENHRLCIRIKRMIRKKRYIFNIIVILIIYFLTSVFIFRERIRSWTFQSNITTFTKIECFVHWVKLLSTVDNIKDNIKQ